MVVANLGYQLHRQSAEENIRRSDADNIAQMLVNAAITDSVKARTGNDKDRTANVVLEDSASNGGVLCARIAERNPEAAQ